MENSERIGQIAMTSGSDYGEPCAVFVRGINQIGLLTMNKLNTGILCFAKPDDTDLLDFNYKTLEKLRAQWFIDEADRTKKRWIDNLNEINGE